MTPAERKKAERQRKRSAGLVPLEVWVRPTEIDKIRLAEALSQNEYGFFILRDSATPMPVMINNRVVGFACTNPDDVLE
jgi:hypothetical protein